MTDNAKNANNPEILEWLSALEGVVKFDSKEQAQQILNAVTQHAAKLGLRAGLINTPYLNSIAPEQQAAMPDDGSLMQKLEAYMRWNAICMVMRAGALGQDLGGHIASYGAIATLYETGLTHFFNAPHEGHGGDLVYFQGHSSPGIYARAYLEGHLTDEHLNAFRQEESKRPYGLSSYPHPWLMPDFWQFPTVSMGLGPLMAIYQAHFLRYLDKRGLAKTDNRHVWAFCGDGELGEPESLGALNIAGREGLDNLIFVVNCNLQRLDGPVWGNGKIVQEYEAVFRGAGWHVIKVLWGSLWDDLFAKDTSGLLKQRVEEIVDGEYQNCRSKDGAHFRETFFGKYPELLKLVEHLSDEELEYKLVNGGHDPRKVYAAYKAATEHKGQPVVILAQTIKGFGMGASGESKNIAHNAKKMSEADRLLFRERFNLPLTDQQITNLEFVRPAADSEAMQYLHAQRQKLGGYLPRRHTDAPKLTAPDLQSFHALFEDTGEKHMSSTMAFVRALTVLTRDKNLKEYLVPIVADESRSFGMEGLYRQIGIYAVAGQHYTPEDKKQLMYYREAETGQLMQEGISEAGAMSAWIAAGSSYASSGVPMIPFFIYYSMFGFQRFGDLVWAAGDIRARGFLVGATSGRTTLAGEGLQHCDGQNLLMFGMVPNCVSYDPTFAYEIAVIVQDGIRRMYQEQEDVFYYFTVMNENYHHPAMPVGCEEGIRKGLYLFKAQAAAKVNLLGSGAILNEVIKASALLQQDFNIEANVWSATSFNELYKDLRDVERHNLLHPDAPKQSYVQQTLGQYPLPTVAATDYIRRYPDQIRSEMTVPYITLGTDGYGRSDTRRSMRDHFEVDAKMIVYSALKALADQGDFAPADLLKAREQLGINPDKQNPAYL